jgi:hypothetical protein
MEPLVNAVIGRVLFVFTVIRWLLEWEDKALLISAAVAAGAYFGTRMAITRSALPTAPSRGGIDV